jgi:hypothetical protein
MGIIEGKQPGIFDRDCIGMWNWDMSILGFLGQLQNQGYFEARHQHL